MDILKYLPKIGISKGLIEDFGIETSFFFTVLLEFNREKGEQGWFVATIEDIEKETGLSRARQNKCIKILEEKQWIMQQNMGMPRKRYFKIIKMI